MSGSLKPPGPAKSARLASTVCENLKVHDPVTSLVIRQRFASDLPPLSSVAKYDKLEKGH
eukprot:CAMPEP_0114688658 /NCGR_PEP_ID=MMETSP0191-20121206/63708_1 /TAXON_ID=126664 /ORGANISM="Sorites sp." /LENGTH=59 /DNA_ID=CAMNT_0001976381 /DNA_START=253 /DNA_END=432 /DNA_ORIENTATION=-